MLDNSNDTTEAWVLDSLSLGPDRAFRSLGSLLLGLGGTALFALLSCVVVGLLVVWLEMTPHRNIIERTTAGLLTFFVGAGSYVATLLAMQLFATCQLPISIRLSMIYVICSLGWLAATWSSGEPITPLFVIWYAPLCFGGLVQHGLNGWRAVSWNQTITKRKLTIFSLLDVTAAIALTLALVTAQDNLDWRGLACYVPAAAVFALLGMHVWARLACLSAIPQRRNTGFGIWMAVNVLLAFLIFLIYAASSGNTPTGILGFISAPLALLVAHVWTEIPLRWLRGCGWALVRTSDVKNSV